MTEIDWTDEVWPVEETDNHVVFFSPPAEYFEGYYPEEDGYDMEDYER